MLYKIIEFKKNLEGEILRLQKNVTIKEAILLKEFIANREINGTSEEHCIYGAMTGKCTSDRACELKGVFKQPDGFSYIEGILVNISGGEKYNAHDNAHHFAQKIYNAITGGAIDWPYFEKEINKLFTV